MFAAGIRLFVAYALFLQCALYFPQLIDVPAESLVLAVQIIDSEDGLYGLAQL